MPLVKIDMIKNVRTPAEIKKLADVVQGVMLEKFNAPPRDRECGVPGTDLIISCSANTREDWSFGMGRAQFITGDL
ncbi:putative tautomerase [Lachnellula willkommii]|uniref:Putative tautomerase n=1 Tax=Lachnellula willkommii TaxID=215461 RepID=A0A559MD27_9HELO|nr:putative tautomerase [Lachnellula willkommii]